MARFTAAVILSLAANAIAGTIPAVIGTEATTNLPGVTLVGAANPSKAYYGHESTATSASTSTITEAAKLKPRIDTPPTYLTITVINSHGSPISTQHVHDPSAPAAVSGNVGPGTIAKGATAAFAVPTGWIGNIALADANYEITSDATLIEGNFVVPDGYSVAVADVDVSYVNGFTMAVTCKCSGTVVSGCNKNLWLYHTCGDEDTAGYACVNPERANESVTTATPFFRPCAGAAYTFPIDNSADRSFGVCQSGEITCCVGPSCTANPNQPSSNA